MPLLNAMLELRESRLIDSNGFVRSRVVYQTTLGAGLLSNTQAKVTDSFSRVWTERMSFSWSVNSLALNVTFWRLGASVNKTSQCLEQLQHMSEWSYIWTNFEMHSFNSQECTMSFGQKINTSKFKLTGLTSFETRNKKYTLTSCKKKSIFKILWSKHIIKYK